MRGLVGTTRYYEQGRVLGEYLVGLGGEVKVFGECSG
jgi:hypothetical protein